MSKELSPEQIQKLLNGIAIPPQPQILVDLQMEQFDPNPSLPRIAKLIAQDVGLAATVLKTVNSAAFGLANHITSAQQAVMLLGIKTVVNIVNGISIRGELSDDDIVALNGFWDTSMDIAIVSQHVAKHIGLPSPEDSYTLGLFHNAGIVLMGQRFPDYGDTLEKCYSGEYDIVTDLEDTLYATNHAIIGYYTARSWRLPKEICDAIADHHNIAKLFTDDSVDNTGKKSLLAVLKIAEYFCGNGRVLGNTDVDTEWETVRPYIYEFTGLGDYDLQNLIDQFKEMGIDSVISHH